MNSVSSSSSMMSQMSQEDILQNTRSVVQSLEALKNEHAAMIRNLVDKLDASKRGGGGAGVVSSAVAPPSTDRTIVEEEISILRNSDEMVHLGIAEATVLIQLSNYLQSIEAEKQKIKSQVKRLCQENAWLRDELAAAQKKLQESEQNAAQLEVELSHLKFLKEIRKYDEDLVTQQHQQQQQQSHSGDDAAAGGEGGGGTRQRDGYGDEEDEQSNNNCTHYFTNTPPSPSVLGL